MIVAGNNLVESASVRPVTSSLQKSASRRGLRVAQFGPYPPFIGGVSMHIRRLHRRLIGDGVRSEVYTRYDWNGPPEGGIIAAKIKRHRPLCYLNSLLHPGREVTSDIVHCHDGYGLLGPSLCRMLATGKTVMITVHDQRDKLKWAAHDPLQRIGALMLLRCRSVNWIAVNKTIKAQLMARGVKDKQCRVIPAYLSPSEADGSDAGMPPTIAEFIACHTPILSAYGFRCLVESGTDVYGFDLCIEAVGELKKCYPRIGLVICIPEVHNEAYFGRLEQRIKELKLCENILFHTQPLDEGYPIWKASDVYVRPTSTDGDSIAIREALSVHTPVVASDAAARPDGVVVFPSRDLRGFVGATKQTLGNAARIKLDLARRAVPDFYEEIVSIYEHIGGQKNGDRPSFCPEAA